ncbi:DUF881 domain-containing protein [Fusibacter bizertensis]|jgi:Uncharacterized protein conserved in bacteria|uniref:DUF881 domain-containing protein n=1 Tax=Fusibacter bizertensis TaxID=1488331 RepID=A0ABT6N8H8_9FIRM|nr:DUF881 domain-containing protein [Fusibacter bizertensis]MDH8676714.1 DUF881 domain-containing protein [Fusibacter bizertensis]
MKWSAKKKRILALTVLLGVLIALQFKTLNSGVKYLSIKEMYTQSIELESQKSELTQLNSKVEELRSQIDAYQTAKEDVQVDYEQFLINEIEATKQIAGLTKLEGPGVVIIITDGTRELIENEDPANIIVHDLDIRAMVDDLRNAGAEAIAINGQRVVFNKSNIQCTGPTIKINDQVFAPPYIIEAIGDRRFLESAINAPGSFSEDLRSWGVFVEVNTSISVTIPAYEGFVSYEFLN